MNTHKVATALPIESGWTFPTVLAVRLPDRVLQVQGRLDPDSGAWTWSLTLPAHLPPLHPDDFDRVRQLLEGFGIWFPEESGDVIDV